MYSGSISLDTHVDAKALPGILASSLRAVQAENVIELPDRVTFTGGMFPFVSSWNVLSVFTSGELVINSAQMRLEYRVSFARIVIFLILFTIPATVLLLVGRIPLPMIAGSVAFMWLWMGGGNVLIGIVRFKKFLRRTLTDAGKAAGG